ncbi:MAG: hypothetical protein KAX05_08985 [Bacteroidales bacterium]|nr:hypothetical protein [Bacteroidales bacterium]
MKAIIRILLFVLVVALLFQCEKESPEVIIPDDNFLNALIELGVDTNGDGIISHAEAEAITSLYVSKDSIADMTGIEAFINLDTLNCSNNQIYSLNVVNNTTLRFFHCGGNRLTSLDVTNNISLIYLYCGGTMSGGDNQLTNLDVSKNTTLEYLLCGRNQLTSLDISNCIDLIMLNVWRNHLSSLDVSNNTKLKNLTCAETWLTSLDISKNTALEYINLHLMSWLHEVCVWTMPFPPAGVEMNTYLSPGIYFTTDCN